TVQKAMLETAAIRVIPDDLTQIVDARRGCASTGVRTIECGEVVDHSFTQDRCGREAASAPTTRSRNWRGASCSSRGSRARSLISPRQMWWQVSRRGLSVGLRDRRTGRPDVTAAGL